MVLSYGKLEALSKETDSTIKWMGLMSSSGNMVQSSMATFLIIL